jgi:alpha-acetolactate decarboxylase
VWRGSTYFACIVDNEVSKAGEGQDRRNEAVTQHSNHDVMKHNENTDTSDSESTLKRDSHNKNLTIAVNIASYMLRQKETAIR